MRTCDHCGKKFEDHQTDDRRGDPQSLVNLIHYEMRGNIGTVSGVTHRDGKDCCTCCKDKKDA